MTVFLAIALMAMVPVLFAMMVYHILHGTFTGLLLIAACLTAVLIIAPAIA